MLWSPAVAPAVTVSAARLQAGPVLAGETILHAESHGNDAVVLRSPVDGGPASEIARMRSAAVDDLWLVRQLAGSAEAFTFRASNVATGPGGGTTGHEVHAGLLGQPASPVHSCSVNGSLGVVGRRVVFDDCEPSVVEAGAGTPREPLAAKGALGARTAGRYAAWTDGGSVVVFDVEARTEAYRLSRRALRGRLRAYDVQPDGTLVAAFQRRGRLRLAFRSLGSRRLRTVTVASARYLQLRAAGNRAALLRHERFAPARASLVLVGRGGRVRRISSRAHASGSTSLDFDGRRLAWGERTPGGVLLRVTTVR
jgi:hypothetical protein